MKETIQESKIKGILSLLVASLGFAFMSFFVKQVALYGDPIPTAQMVLFRNAISVIVSFIMVVIHKSSFYGKRENLKYLIARSTFGTIGMVLYFYSISNLYLGDANMLNKLSTFFLIGFSSFFLKEKVKPYQIIAIVIAFIGSLLIIKPSFDIVLFPYITSILAALFAGAAYTVLRVLGKKEEYYTIVLFFSSFSVITLLPYVVFFDHASMTFMQVLWLILVGLAATVGQFGTTLAYKYAPAKDIGIFNYSNVLFAAILGFSFYQEIPDIYSILGYMTIFFAAFYIFKTNK
jgi:drug/metabolite transporter (DMT)-like permease